MMKQTKHIALCGFKPYFSKLYLFLQVKLLEIIENLSFMTVYFATNSSMYQDRILNRIVFKYLYDNEYSVRRAASKCLLRYGHSLNCILVLYQV